MAVADSTTVINDNLMSKSSVVYNILGSPIRQKDAVNREVTISYTDDWNDSVSRTTYAYPTTITDPNGNSSVVEYRFDTGANVWAKSPTPAGSGNTNGKTTSREYNDTTGRLTKSKIDTTGAYSRYVYATNGTDLTSYATIIDADGDTNLGEDEVATESVFDGAGRLLKTRTANPNSTGGYTGKKVEYDMLGRAFRETVPTEINTGWNPAGDDYRSNTWLWNTREFDWKGRLERSIPSDSNGSDGKDTLYEYEGCGCAGGQITTVKGPVTTAIDVGGTTQTTKRRTQKIHADILGRTARTELWDLDGGGSSPYSTVKNTYNGRDQVTVIEEFVGGITGTHQDTTISYDGHGRPYQVHKPEFDSGKYTTTTYNADDSVATVTDPRDAVTAYTYGLPTTSEKRAVVTNITYSVPSGSNIPDPSDVAFTYDNAGNRTQMTDGLGTVSYVYDELSRLKSESRNFTDTLTNEPSSGVHKLEYEYTLSGLKSYKDPFGESVTYTHDSTGRTTQIGASAFTGRTTGTGAFATNVSYRAFGAIKGVNFATDSTTYVTVGYDSALRPSSYESTSSANSIDIHDRAYVYYNDGMLKETTNAVDAKFGQKNEYDFAGRLKKNDFGNTTVGVPYKQTISYDEFNHISARSTWDKDNNQRNYTAGFTNNRKSSGGYQNGTDTFDAAGRVTLNHFYNGKDNDKRWTFDAGGRMTEWLETSPYASTYWDEGATITFDGDGRAVKKRKRHRSRSNGNTAYYEENEYDIMSSVLGKTITTANDTGAKTKTNVYLGSSVMAEQVVDGTNTFVSFKHVDPLTGSHQSTDATGEIFPNDIERIELDPLGTWANPSEAELQTPVNNYKSGGDMGNPEFGCTMESGAPAPCSTAAAEARYVGTLPSFEIIWGRDPRTMPGVIEVPPGVEPGDDEYESQSSHAYGFASAYSFINADNFVAGHQGLMNFGETREGGWGWLPKPITCPPTGQQLMRSPLLKKELIRQFERDSGHRTANPLENGGWVYQYTSGRSKGKFFYQPVEASRRSSSFIDLTEPPTIRNARVVARVHTHPYTNEEQDIVNEFEASGDMVPYPDGANAPFFADQGTGPSQRDHDLSKETMPSLVVYEAVSRFGGGPATSIVIANVGRNSLFQKGCE